MVIASLILNLSYCLDLTNLHIPSPLIKPIDYDDMPSPSQQSGAQSTTIYNQGRTPSGQIAGKLLHFFCLILYVMVLVHLRKGKSKINL